MASRFAAAAAACATAVDGWYGEDFLLVPRAKAGVNDRSGADPMRAPSPFRGVFVAKGAVLHAHGRNRADATTTAVAAETPTIRVTVPPGVEPRIDDHVTRIGSGERFRVASQLERQYGGVRLKLTEIRS